MIKHLIIAWFLSQASMASVLGDWFVITKNDTFDNCIVYKGNGHNLFGSICDENITALIGIAGTLQGLVLANVSLSVILVFTTIVRPNMNFFRFVTAFLIVIMSTMTTILWHTTHKEINTEYIRYTGVGWYFQLATIIFSITSCIATFSISSSEI